MVVLVEIELGSMRDVVSLAAMDLGAAAAAGLV